MSHVNSSQSPPSTPVAVPPLASLIRHRAGSPCPVCGGHAGLARGRGIRCAGFNIGVVSFCTREEHSGRAELDITTEPPAYKHLLIGRCPCGIEHDAGLESHDPVAGKDSRPSLPLEARHEIYSSTVELLSLRDEARADLTRRGLLSEDIDAVGYRSIPRKGSPVDGVLRRLVDRFGEETLRQCPGFVDKNGRTNFWTASGDRDGYIVPYRDEQGRITGIQLKLLSGRYETARGTRTADVYHVAGDPAPGGDLYVTEGGTKAEVAHRLGLGAVIGLPGQSLAQAQVDLLARLSPGRVIVALDQEANLNTERARERWLKALAEAGLATYLAVWEGADLGGPKGIDDLLAAGGKPRIRAVSRVPAEFGARRQVRQTTDRAVMPDGLSLASARRVVEDAVCGFIQAAAGRR